VPRDERNLLNKENFVAPVVPFVPLIASAIGVGGMFAAGGGGKGPKLELPPPPKPIPAPPKPDPAPPAAAPQQELSEIEKDADRARANAIAASRRRKGRMASILTSPLGAPQASSNLSRPVLGS
jgi:hypothetical protein